MSNLGAWLNTPNFALIEIVSAAGYHTVLMDAEHGTFDLVNLERAIPFARALGLTVLVKASAPERAPIQQALDFGADGIVIPHIKSAAHARAVCDFAKLPPLGDRSLAGGRMMSYGGFDADWCAHQNRRTRCLPMIEDPSAMAEVTEVLELDTVDGICVGPSDLFARSLSGGYVRTDSDWADIRRLTRAARDAGKDCILPAWSAAEQELGFAEQADTVLVLQEFSALRSAFENAIDVAGKLMRTTEPRS